MANEEHLAKLEEGVEAWNAWRRSQRDEFLTKISKGGEGKVWVMSTPADWDDYRDGGLKEADLSEADLSDENLNEADLRRANLGRTCLYGTSLGGAILRGANLSGADLCQANLSGADLSGADLSEANPVGAILRGANLSGADLSGVDLWYADLSKANLSKADLRGAQLQHADLSHASMVGTNLTAAKLDGSRIYGVSVWDVETDDDTEQTNLIITPEGEPTVMVDDLEVAQFIYLILNREKIRNVIDTVTRKGVLVLGRFGDGGLDLLQTVAAWLRKPENGGYLPLLFDFPRPDSKTYTETVRTLASLARFVIVDLSGPSVPQEITATVDLHEIPFVPILEESREDWSMFKDFLVKERVIDVVPFTDAKHLLEILPERVIAPAERLIEKRQKKLDEIYGRA